MGEAVEVGDWLVVKTKLVGGEVGSEAQGSKQIHACYVVTTSSF